MKFSEIERDNREHYTRDDDEHANHNLDVPDTTSEPVTSPVPRAAGSKSARHRAEIRREADGSGVSQPFSTWSTTMTPSRLSGSREQRPPMLLSTSSLSRELV
jgi:hypothetical protein